MTEYIKFPSGDDFDRVADEFKTKWGVPQCIGAVDGCHIPICAPNEQHTDYYNRKGWYSMIVEGLVDVHYCFLNVCIGWPGSVHDARVFGHSNLYKKITHGHLVPNKSISISGVHVPLYMIGDSVYLMQSWLMKPFAYNSDITACQRNYNYRICRARIVVENAFGQLKARWRHVMRRNDIHTDNIPHVIAATCVLHNICEVHHEHFNDTWLEHNEGAYDQPATVTTRDTSVGSPHTIRNVLLSYFQSN